MARRVRWLPLLLLLPSPLSAAPPRAGGEFVVNTYTTNQQFAPEVAGLASGAFLIIWDSAGQDGHDRGIFGQRFTAAGSRLGVEFGINLYTTGLQGLAHIGTGADGNFVIVWTSRDGQDGSEQGIFGRRFDAGGNPLGGEFRVNAHTTDGQFFAWVGLDSVGNFVVAWTSEGTEPSGLGVRARRFLPNGDPVGDEFAVNNYVTGNQLQANLAVHDDGSFVVVWIGPQPGSGYDVFARRFDSAGSAIGNEFRVNSTTASNQLNPHVAGLPGGSFVVVWETFDGAESGVVGRRYDALGAPQGGEFAINTYTTHVQQFPRVASVGAGSFVVVWESWYQDGSGTGAFGRVFDAAGNSAEAEFLVNTGTLSNQRLPAVAADHEGRFVVAWSGFPSDGGSSYGVRAQRFGDLIFKDGLESGGLGAWSSSAGGGDLTANGAAALAGTNIGLQAVVDDTDGLFVQDDSPADEGRYRARFYLDPNGFDPGEAQSHLRTRTFIAFTESPTRRVAAVVLRRIGGVYGVMARARLDDDAQANTGFFDVSDAAHAVEIELVRASGPDAEDGTFELWIDGASRIQLTGLDNSLAEVDFARLGALSVKTGAGGTLFFDEFESRRQSYVGLLP